MLRGDGSLEWMNLVMYLVEGLGFGRRASEDQFGGERSSRERESGDSREGLLWYALVVVGLRTLMRRRMNHEWEVEKLMIGVSCQNGPEIQRPAPTSGFRKREVGLGNEGHGWIECKKRTTTPADSRIIADYST